MIDVLLAHSYYLKYDAKQAEKMRPYPPLATLYAASALREAGYSVALFDAMLSEGEHEFEIALQQHQPRFVALYEDSFNFLVKMCLTRMRAAAHRMSEAARDSGAAVIAAGPDVSDHPNLYLMRGVQYAILGEADHTLHELLDLLSGRRGRYLLEISGLAWSDPHAPEGVFRTARRLPERHIDTFPMPAWDLLDVERYRAAWKRAHGYFSLNMVTTRGCPYHCNWCAKPIWGQHYVWASFCSSATPARPSRTSWRRCRWCATACPTASASVSAIRCPARHSTRW
jgi:anaerobic magnesium-protoporphyrin IX monomethyl ester cyclase